MLRKYATRKIPFARRTYTYARISTHVYLHTSVQHFAGILFLIGLRREGQTFFIIDCSRVIYVMLARIFHIDCATVTPRIETCRTKTITLQNNQLCQLKY